MHLADKCYYTLKFSPFIIHEAPYVSKGNEASVRFDTGSRTWDLSNEERIQLIQNLFKYNKRKNVAITDGRGYASFNISNCNEKELQEQRRQKALAKLTNEEKKLLGLAD